jgi:DNA adenine methylase
MPSTVTQQKPFDTPIIKTHTAKPFLKWAGGKGQLIATINGYLPTELKTGKITKYAEPFIGGGALFFHIAQTYKDSIKQFYISDTNEELIILYFTIRRNVKSLIETLTDIERQYFSLEPAQQKEHFLKVRQEYNEQKPKFNFCEFSNDWITRSADMIFLNRMCFNGLFRVNSKGLFNVPFGDYKNPRICDSTNLKSVSKILEKTIIEHADFTKCDKFVDDKTFTFFDPPYRPLSKTASFNSYSKESFGDTKQEELAKFYRYLANKGAFLMLSNSDPKNTNPDDDFFDNLYKDFNIERVKASRAINSNGAKRGQIFELLITNYDNQNLTK